MVSFEEVQYVIGNDGLVIATLEKSKDGTWAFANLRSGHSIGPISAKQIYKKLKELNNAEV